MELSDGRNEILERESCILSDGLVHHSLHQWNEIYRAKSYQEVDLNFLHKWKIGYDEEVVWWQHPNVHTTQEILDEMLRFHGMICRERNFLEKTIGKHEKFAAEKSELFCEIINSSYAIIQSAQRKRLCVPDDDFGNNIWAQLNEVAPIAKYRGHESMRNAKIHAKGDESLVAVAIYQCLTGTPTSIVTRDSDIKRLTRQSLGRLANQFSTGETLNEFPLHIYFMNPNEPAVMLVYDSNVVKPVTVSQPTSSVGTSR